MYVGHAFLQLFCSGARKDVSYVTMEFSDVLTATSGCASVRGSVRRADELLLQARGWTLLFELCFFLTRVEMFYMGNVSLLVGDCDMTKRSWVNVPRTDRLCRCSK
jgi:hypothetical protein